MDKALALVVLAGENDAERSLAGVAVDALGSRHRVELLDLPGEGFVPAMSAEELERYYGADPITDPSVRRHARLVTRAETLVFVFPTRWWNPPPILQAWLERVLVPGVAFVFDEAGRVRPNLDHVRTIAAITTNIMPPGARVRGGDGGRAKLMRALPLDVGHRVRRVWICLNPTQARAPTGRVKSELSRL